MWVDRANRRARGILGNLTFLALTLAACEGSTPSSPDAGPDADGGVPAFDDHTLPRLDGVAAFASLLPSGPGLESVKFVIQAFDEDRRDTVFMDGNFYTLHDEWYWYRLVNGQTVMGDEAVEPLRGFRFGTIALVYAWAHQQTRLPLDLAFTSDDRLYSPRFYQLALDAHPRNFGVGGVIHVPASATRQEGWYFELEYTDRVTHAELVTFFETLERELPAEIYASLKWVVRSPEQELLAQEMEREQLRFYDRLARYRELSTPGAKEVYGEGIAAGRVRVVRAGEPLEGGAPTDILVLEALPDYLPPCAGLVTSLPQTPLAHVAVLARNRGIPNVYLGGAAYDPLLDQLGRVSAPVLLRGAGADRVDLVQLTEDEYRGYLATLVKTPASVEEIPLETVLPIYDLESLDEGDSDRWRPVLGGKSTGYLSVLAPEGVTHPDRPMAISIKPYVEHLASLRARIDALLRHPSFVGDARARFLMLEGEADFRERYTAAADLRFLSELKTMHPQGTLLGDILAAGGVRAMIRAKPMAADTLAAITAGLRANFGDFALGQGLRFRSSSNVEDIEGFNGAGLYDSNTGFLDAEQLPTEELRKQTVEWAVKKTWASYWSFEGFEERRLELIDHLSGSMGVTVHARFDDDHEVSNGVMVTTIYPPPPLEGPQAGRRETIVMEVDAQHFAVSVTNPDPLNPQLPEVTRVILEAGAGAPRIERVRRSTLSPEGRVVLDDAKVLSLFEQTRAVAELWLDRVRRQTRKAEQAPRMVTLDFEYREVGPGWPALRSGETRPQRLVVKQARSLDPGLRTATPLVRSLPFPKDVLVRSRRITRTTCRGPDVNLTVIDALSDPLATPDLGYDTLPFVASVAVLANRDEPALGLTAGSTLSFSHLELEARHPSGLAADVVGAARARLERIELEPSGHYRIARGASELSGELSCSAAILRATPREYLYTLLASKSP